VVHLGPLQKLTQGAILYVGAKTQYGSGHQPISYLMMQQAEFSLLGFRASFLGLNIIAGMGVAALAKGLAISAR
jgi:hypothetical protein